MELFLWVGFFTLVVSLLAVDLGVHRKRPHVLSLREALAWTGFYVTLAMVFCVFVYFTYQNNWFDAGVEWGKGPVRSRGSAGFLHGVAPGVVSLHGQHLRHSPHLRLFPGPG